MITTLTPSNQEFVNNLSAITSRLNRDEQNLSSGVSLRLPSDNPDEVSQLLQARAALSASQQVSTNLGIIGTEVNTGEQTLESAVQLFDQVQTLGAEGATGTQTAATRTTLAQQLQSIEQQFVSFADTSIEGRYIFSGDSDQTPPYTYNAANANPVSAYQGTASTRVALSANGTTFPIALTAQQIFDSTDPATNLFSSLNGLITALNNNDQSAITTAVNGLSGVAQYLNNQLAFYGSTQDNIASSTNDAQNQQTQLQAEISTLQDDDASSTILDMTQAQTSEQAALQSEATIPRQTLFDFLG